jgi:phage terminase large subunit-like protein
MKAFPKDPATNYARAVVAGTEIASRSVVLACQRHLDDLAHAAARGLVWDPQEAINVCAFFPDVLRLPEQGDDDGTEGRPFVLAGWEEFVAGSLMGWRTTAGPLRYRVGYVELGKGSGKTAFGAGLLTYRLVRGRAGSHHF